MGLKALRVHVPNNQVFGGLVLLIAVLILGKYMTLGTWIL